MKSFLLLCSVGAILASFPALAITIDDLEGGADSGKGSPLKRSSSQEAEESSEEEAEESSEVLALASFHKAVGGLFDAPSPIQDLIRKVLEEDKKWVVDTCVLDSPLNDELVLDLGTSYYVRRVGKEPAGGWWKEGLVRRVERFKEEEGRKELERRIDEIQKRKVTPLGQSAEIKSELDLFFSSHPRRKQVVEAYSHAAFFHPEGGEEEELLKEIVYAGLCSRLAGEIAGEEGRTPQEKLAFEIVDAIYVNYFRDLARCGEPDTGSDRYSEAFVFEVIAFLPARTQ